MPTSLALHLALALLLLVRLPELSAPAKEQSVSVELVPTPKNEKQPEQKPTKQKADEVRNQRARAQPQAFESAAAPTENEKPPEPDLPPAAPKKTETPSVRPEASRPAPAKPENAANERPAENRTALAELRADSTDAANTAADAAAAPPAAPIPQEKPVLEEARAEPTQNPAEANAEREFEPARAGQGALFQKRLVGSARKTGDRQVAAEEADPAALHDRGIGADTSPKTRSDPGYVRAP